MDKKKLNIALEVLDNVSMNSKEDSGLVKLANVFFK